MHPCCRRQARISPIKMAFSASSIACVCTWPKTVVRLMFRIEYAHSLPGAPSAIAAGLVASRMLVQGTISQHAAIQSFDCFPPQRRLSFPRMQTRAAAQCRDPRWYEPAPPVRRLRTAAEAPRASPQDPGFPQRGFSRRFPYRYCLILGCSRAIRQERLTLKGHTAMHVSE